MNGNRVVPIAVSRGYSGAGGGNKLRRNSTRRGQEVIEIVRSHTGSHRRSHGGYTHDESRYSGSVGRRSNSHRGHRSGFWSRLFSGSPRSSTSYNRPRSSSHSRTRPFLHPNHRTRPLEYGLGTYLRGLFTRRRELCAEGRKMMEEAAAERRRERRRRLRRLRDEGLAIRMGATAVGQGRRVRERGRRVEVD